MVDCLLANRDFSLMSIWTSLTLEIAWASGSFPCQSENAASFPTSSSACSAHVTSGCCRGWSSFLIIVGYLIPLLFVGRCSDTFLVVRLLSSSEGCGITIGTSKASASSSNADMSSPGEIWLSNSGISIYSSPANGSSSSTLQIF